MIIFVIVENNSNASPWSESRWQQEELSSGSQMRLYGRDNSSIPVLVSECLFVFSQCSPEPRDLGSQAVVTVPSGIPLIMLLIGSGQVRQALRNIAWQDLLMGGRCTCLWPPVDRVRDAWKVFLCRPSVHTTLSQLTGPSKKIFFSNWESKSGRASWHKAEAGGREGSWWLLQPDTWK